MAALVAAIHDLLSGAIDVDARNKSGHDEFNVQAVYRTPARMKLWTNWRWNRRKARSSGAEVISVAAQITDQSIPWSVEENTCSPTVSGRASTELVTIKGHRKLFQ